MVQRSRIVALIALLCVSLSCVTACSSGSANSIECPECGGQTTEYFFKNHGKCYSCYSQEDDTLECPNCGGTMSSYASEKYGTCISCADADGKSERMQKIKEKQSGDSSVEDSSETQDKKQSSKSSRDSDSAKSSSSEKGTDSKFTTCPMCGEKALRSSIKDFGMCSTCYVEKEQENGRSDFSYSGGSSTGSSSSSSENRSDSESCPICGGATTDSQLRWQGMCKSCYQTYEQLKSYQSK